MNYRGYLVEISRLNDSNKANRITIGINVSSDWKVYPCYGFVSKYPKMSDKEIDSVIRKLSRHHINGIQFYDWHNTHHDPLSGTVENPDKTWKDIANRTIYRTTIEKYIETAHKYGMNTMAYNLLYGAWFSGINGEVKAEWGLYKDRYHREPFYLNMPENWADDIYFFNPANAAWKNYLLTNMHKVFEAFNFDGWHIDQIGDLGLLYTYDGEPAILKDTFTSFIKESKNRLNVKLVMNAAGQYGWSEIAQAPVEFLYNEVWNPDSTFNDLVSILEQNHTISGLHNTVLAAYMNYANSSSSGYFNTPGILLTDAVIFANGGSHLELGEHMLCHEYFPNDNLKTTPELDDALVCYYDFSVAYQTLLRNPQLKSCDLLVHSKKYPTSTTAEKGNIWVICKSINNKSIIHFINLLQMENTSWRDTYGTRKEPEVINNIPITIACSELVKAIIQISPDFNGGLPEQLTFEQRDGQIEFSISALKYWTTIIFEY
jgi:dextranase